MSDKRSEVPVQLRQTVQELRCLEATMREARARLAAIVASANDAIIAMNLDSIITDWNLWAEKIFGFRTNEVTLANLPAPRLRPVSHFEK